MAGGDEGGREVDWSAFLELIGGNEVVETSETSETDSPNVLDYVDNGGSKLAFEETACDDDKDPINACSIKNKR